MSNDPDNDKKLFSALSGGGAAAEAALNHIYDRYAKRLFGFLRGKGFTAHEAEDILQDVFLKIFRHADRFGHSDNPKAYLYRTVINCGNDLLRRNERKAPEADLEDNEAVESMTGDSHCGERSFDGFFDCLSAAYERFEKKAPERGLVIRLAVIEGMSGSEVAEAVGRSYGAAREFLSQTRKQFQAMLIELCGEYFGEGVVDG